MVVSTNKITETSTESAIDHLETTKRIEITLLTVDSVPNHREDYYLFLAKLLQYFEIPSHSRIIKIVSKLKQNKKY